MKLKFFLANIFLFVFNLLAYANDVVDVDGDGFEGGGDPTDTPPETEGARRIPIDMYEWVLLGVAIALILGYYLYSKRKRIANS